MTEVRDMSKLIEAAKKMGITEEELRAILPMMIEVQDEKNKGKAKKSNTTSMKYFIYLTLNKIN